MINILRTISSKYLSSLLLLALFAFNSNAQNHPSDSKTPIDIQLEISEYQKNLTDTYSNEETSILSDADREKFIALGGHPFFPINSKYRITADLTVFSKPERIEMKTSTSRIANYKIYCKATFMIDGQNYELFVYQNMAAFASVLHKDMLFLPFTDLTSGEETYGGGRYLDLSIPKNKNKIIIDFNKAYHPYCAYSEGYSCPIPPQANFVEHKIEAGIKFLDIKLGLLANDLLEKSIAYHDPKNNWNKLKTKLSFKTIMADKSERKRNIIINNEKAKFKFISTYQEGQLEYIVKNNIGEAKWNGSTNIPEDIAKKYRISNDRAVMFRNYYTYLYGMPMKLKDPGIVVNQLAQQVDFYGKTYNRIKVNYDPEVGTDTWYFYFNTITHALEAYQFFKDESKNDGEYILFEKTKVIDNIKIPSIRHWYYNAGQKFLATDFIE